jgi:hypothetical protein
MTPGLHIGAGDGVPAGASSKQVAFMMRAFFGSHPDIATNLSLDLLPEGERRLEVHFLYARARGRGHASLALQTLGILCDRYGVELTCNATSIADTLKDNAGCLDQEQLVSFYRKHGFQLDQRDTGHASMTRASRLRQ